MGKRIANPFAEIGIKDNPIGPFMDFSTSIFVSRAIAGNLMSKMEGESGEEDSVKIAAKSTHFAENPRLGSGNL